MISRSSFSSFTSDRCVLITYIYNVEKQKPISQQSRQGGQIVPLQKEKFLQAIELEEVVLEGAMMIDKKELILSLIT